MLYEEEDVGEDVGLESFSSLGRVASSTEGNSETLILKSQKRLHPQKVVRVANYDCNGYNLEGNSRGMKKKKKRKLIVSGESTALDKVKNDDNYQDNYTPTGQDLLPVHFCRREIVNSVAQNQVTLVLGETGSGKTTQIPQFLMSSGFAGPQKPLIHSDGDNNKNIDTLHAEGKDIGGFDSSTCNYVSEGKLSDDLLSFDCRGSSSLCASVLNGSQERQRLKFRPKMIGITQPRRVAATSLARRVAEESNTSIGDLVGYRVRFDSKVSQNTRIQFLTDGMLIRDSLGDRLLSRFSVLILDEAHERSLRTEILLGLLKCILRVRPDLRILIMSATLDYRSFLDFFDNRAKVRQNTFLAVYSFVTL